MSRRHRFSMLVMVAVVAGCGGPAHSEREIDAAPDRAAEQAQPVPADIAPPLPERKTSSSDVREKVAAIFGRAIRRSTAREPRYITGDFNGDGSEDLAVIVKPDTGALTELNSPVANWILKDVEPATTQDDAHHPLPARVEAADVLLAVIHGYGAAGWRSPEARQTFLLRNAATSDMEKRSLEGLIPVPQGRKFTGDVILTAHEGRRSFLYWTGAGYLRHHLDSGPAGAAPSR